MNEGAMQVSLELDPSGFKAALRDIADAANKTFESIKNKVSEDIFGKQKKDADGLGTSINALKTKLNSLNKEFDDTAIGSKRFKELQEEIRKTGKEIERAQGKSKGGLRGAAESLASGGGLSGALGGLGVGAAAAGGIAAVGAALGVVALKASQAGAALESTKASFQTMLKAQGSTDPVADAERMVSAINAFADRTPFANDELLNASKTMMGFGVSALDVQNTLEQLGNASASTGANIQDLSLIYGQVLSKGRLQGEEYLQFAEKQVVLQKDLAAVMGIAPQEVAKAMEQGKISAEIFQEAFARATKEGGQFADGIKNQANTINGKLSTITGSFGSLLAKIGEAGNSKLLGGVLDWAVKFIEGLTKAIEKTQVMKVVFESIGLVVETFFAIFSDLFGIFVSSNKELGLMEMLMTAIKVSALIFATVWTTIYGLIRAVINLMGIQLELMKSIVTLDFSGMGKSWNKFTSQVKGDVGKIGNLWAGAFGPAQAAGGALTVQRQATAGAASQKLGAGGAGADRGSGKPTWELSDALEDVKAFGNEQVKVRLRVLDAGIVEGLQKANLKVSEEIIGAATQAKVEQEFKVVKTAGTTEAAKRLARTKEGATISEVDVVGTGTEVAAAIEAVPEATAQVTKLGVEAEKTAKSGEKFSNAFDMAGKMLGRLAGASEELQEVLGDVLQKLSDLAIQQMNNLYQIAQNTLRDNLNKFNLVGEVYLENFNRNKQAEIDTFAATEDAKIAILRDSIDTQMALIDEEFNAIKSQLDKELKAKQDALKAEHEKNLDMIETKSADKEQGLVLSEIQEEDYRIRQEELQAEHEEKLAEAQAEIAKKKEREKKEHDKRILAAESEKQKGMIALEKMKTEQEISLKRQIGMVNYLGAMAGFKLSQAQAVANNRVQTALGVANAVASSMQYGLAGPFIAAMLSGIVIASGAMTEATIRSTPAPMPPAELFFAEGGLVPGPRGAGDVVPARLTPGELVVDRQRSDKLLSMVDTIGGQRMNFEPGSIIVQGDMNEDAIDRLAEKITERQGFYSHRAAF